MAASPPVGSFVFAPSCGGAFSDQGEFIQFSNPVMEPYRPLEDIRLDFRITNNGFEEVTFPGLAHIFSEDAGITLTIKHYRRTVRTIPLLRLQRVDNTVCTIGPGQHTDVPLKMSDVFPWLKGAAGDIASISFSVKPREDIFGVGSPLVTLSLTAHYFCSKSSLIAEIHITPETHHIWDEVVPDQANPGHIGCNLRRIRDIVSVLISGYSDAGEIVPVQVKWLSEPSGELVRHIGDSQYWAGPAISLGGGDVFNGFLDPFSRFSVRGTDTELAKVVIATTNLQ